MESVKSVSQIYSPVSGEIIGFNDELKDNPSSINEDPYGDGWICNIKASDISDLGGLLDASGYAELIGD